MIRLMYATAQRWKNRALDWISKLNEDTFWVRKLVIVSVLLSLLLTWPAVLHLNSEIIGSPDADGGKHFWTLWWMKHSLIGLHQIPHSTGLVNFPVGMELYPIEPLNGIGVSLLFFLPLILSTNLLALANLSLTGIAGGLLGREITGSEKAGFVSSILLQSSATALFTLHSGVGELQHLWWLPVCFICWHRLRTRMRWRDGLVLGLGMAGASLSCFYYGLFAGLGIAILSLCTLWAGKKTPKLILRYGVAAGLGLLIVLPVSSNFASTFGEGEPPRVGLMTYITNPNHGQPVTDPPSARLEIADLYQGAGRATASREDVAYGGGRYLGWPAILLVFAAFGLRTRKVLPWIVVGGVGIVFALGSYLVVAGEVATTAVGTRYEMPFLFLNRALGYLVEPVNFPVRFLSLTACAIAVCGAWVASSEFKKYKLANVALVLALLNALAVQWGQMIPRPMPRFSPPAYPALSELPTDFGPLLDLTQAMRADPETRNASQSAQIIHRQAVQSVPIERIEKFAEEGQVWVKALPLVQWFKGVDSGIVTLQAHEKQAEESLALLSDRGFSGMLLLGPGAKRNYHPDVYNAVKGVLGEPVVEDGRAAVWNLPSNEFSALEIEGLLAEQEIRYEALRGVIPGELNRPLR
jgi:hypothetical protein